jgi:hypothetical protein
VEEKNGPFSSHGFVDDFFQSLSLSRALIPSILPLSLVRQTRTFITAMSRSFFWPSTIFCSKIHQ